MSELELKLKLTADGQGLTGQVRASREQVEQLNRSVNRTGDAAGRGARGLDTVGDSADTAGQSLNTMRGYATLAAGALATLGAGRLVGSLIDVNTETQRLQASLATVTGSTEAATAAWETLEEFAKTTPFTLDQSVNGFVKMKALGLDPTTEALTSFGNTASAMGRDLNQMIEAVADASTSEFERLKEFGIKARQEGDQVSFIFQGTTTTIGNNADEIVRYLEKIGNTEFASAMQRQMATLGGASSNLQDNIDALFREIGEAGANSLASSAILTLSESAETLSENLDTVGDVAKVFAVLIGGRLAASVGTATASFVAGQIQAARYQMAIASLVTTSRVAAASQMALATSVGVASRALAVLGGPIGLVAVAAGSIYAFREELGLVEPAAQTTAEAIDEVNRAFRDLSATGRQDLISDLEQQLAGVRGEVAQLKTELDELPESKPRGAASLYGSSSALEGATLRGQIEDRLQAIELLEVKLQAARKAQNALLNETPTIPGGNPLDNPVEPVDTAAIEKLMEELVALRTRNALIESGIEVSESAKILEEALLKIRLEAQGLTAAEAEEYVQLKNSIEQAEQSAERTARERQSLAEQFRAIREELYPSAAEVSQAQRYFDIIDRYAALENLDPSQVEAMKDRIRDGLKEAAEESAEDFANPFEATANSVAQSLQNAIASGDWDSVGDAIGASLATSISGIVSKSVTESLASNITANSGAFAQIDAAFAGPIAGAVAGGVAQLAIAEVSDWLSGSDWDPTEARQRAQGTGTVLGSIDAKSESIARAVEGSETGIGQLVGINQGMLRALQSLQAGISGASSRVARARDGIEFETNDRFSQDQLAMGGLGIAFGPGGFATGLGPMSLFTGLLGPFGDVLDGVLGGLFSDTAGFLDDLTGGLLSDIGGAVFGGGQEIKDVGIQLFGATLDEMIAGVREGDRRFTAQAFASIEEDGGWFGSDKRFDRFERLGTDAERQISLVFGGIQDSVVAGAEALGFSSSAIEEALSEFRVKTQKISLEGLDAEEQAAELEAVFSGIFDQAAGAVIPFLGEFQRAGEGLGETLSRVANQTLVAEEAVHRLGIGFDNLSGRNLALASERLIEASGGLESFIGSMQSFISSFATDAQQFEIAQSDINRALGQVNLTLPETRQGYFELVQAQNGSTESGAENIATLLRLREAADTYYSMLEDRNDDLIDAQRARLDSALEASDAVANAIDRLTSVRGQSENSRDAARSTLQQMVDAGQVQPGAQLNEALDSVTGLSANDFASYEDYLRDFVQTNQLLGDLQAITDEQVTIEERMLSSLESQTLILQEGQQSQLDALRGIRGALGSPVQSAVPASQPVFVGGAGVESDRGLAVMQDLLRELRTFRQDMSHTQGSLVTHAFNTSKRLKRLDYDGVLIRS